ncbi:hypothetical protein GKC34_05235, partial [Lactobacillus salivarius]|nr:hypothetical protein [Ligilactobacillus salivarius]
MSKNKKFKQFSLFIVGIISTLVILCTNEKANIHAEDTTTYTRVEPQNKVTKNPRAFDLSDSGRASDKDDFSKVFKTNGTANLPSHVDSNTDILLTPDQTGAVGGLTLRSRISLEHPFTLVGHIGFNNPDMVKEGDGIGIFFHTGKPQDLGNSGAGMGAAGLPNVNGFKFDLFRNTTPPPMIAEADPQFGKDNQGYGAAIHTVHGSNGWVLYNYPGSIKKIPVYNGTWAW